MTDEKNFVCGQIPFIMNIGYRGDPNAKTIKENESLKLKDVMKCTSIDVSIESSGELTPESQQEILEEAY